MKKILLILPVLLFGFSCASIKINTPVNDPPDSISQTQQGATLDYSYQNLSSVPTVIFKKADTENLDLSHNNLTGAIPAEIRFLQQLKTLNLSYNKMTGLPAELGQLANLESLDVSYNQLTGLPYEIGNLKKLEVLDLTGNSYSTQDLERIKKDLPNTSFVTGK